MTRKHVLNIVANVCRIVLAIVFIFSGFVKTIDPWGTAIKVNEYLLSFGLDWVGDYRFGFAIWLCGAEMMMGLMLLFKVRTPLVSTFSLLTMTGFTALTFYIAQWGTVEDCGCFGDAIKLDNWQTFYKNLVLWPMSFIVWFNARHGKLIHFSTADLTKMAFIMCFSFGLGTYCYRHLPLIDFLPYKVGVNLREAVSPADDDLQAMVRCRNVQDGSIREFDMADTTWYDTSHWEYVESYEVSVAARDMSLAEFNIFDDNGSRTAEILNYEGTTHIICAVKLDMITDQCRRNMEQWVAEALAQGDQVVAITASPLDNQSTITLGENTIPLYNIDATTLITMLRAKTGVVTLHDGVITQKLNCRDM